MKYNIILISAILFLSASTHARLLEGDGTTERSTVTSTTRSSGLMNRWEGLKTRVSQWWNKSETKPDSTSTSGRNVATVPTQQAPAAVDVSPSVQGLVEQLPKYDTTEARQQVEQVVKSDLSTVKSQKTIVEAKPGRAADVSLPKTKSGVATFVLEKKIETKNKKGEVVYKTQKVDKIPELDIGEEKTISRTDWKIQSIDVLLNEFNKPIALKSPDVTPETQIKLALGAPIEKPIMAKDMKVSVFGPDGKVSFDTVRKIVLNPSQPVQVTEYEIRLLSEEEVKMLKAQILLESGKKCHLATGLLTDLTDAKNTTIQSEATYQLALCLHQMGLYTESIRRMKDVLKLQEPVRLRQALKILTHELPKEFEEEVATELKKITDMSIVPEESRDAFHYIIAKASSRQGHFNTAFEHAGKVSEKFKQYLNAQYIMSVSEYSLNRRKESIDRQKKIKTHIDTKGGDKDLRALIALNLGRIAFQEKQYEESIKFYNEVKKDHSLWVDALIEQGWTQLLVGDAPGAIGNMYSIHSPYFKSVYQPESYVVRTIGYLNICQFGDAYKTLSLLEQTHRAWLASIQEYRKGNSALKHYQTLVKYLKSPTTSQNIDGVPYQVLRELGRHRDYLNLQEAINARIDESEQYGFLSGLIEKDMGQVRWLIKKSQERMAELNSKLAKAEKEAKLAQNVNQWKKEKRFEETVQEALKFELQVYGDSHKLYKNFQRTASVRLEKKKSDLQLAAGEVLRTRMKNLETRLISILDNNELLRYEVFAGSGENIRFHAAGGKAVGDRRVHHTAKPTSKSLQWKFDGEFWEDEIGHYRSGLKDNCPKSARSASVQ